MGFGLESLLNCCLPEVDQFFPGVDPDAWGGTSAGKGGEGAGFRRELCVDGVMVSKCEFGVGESRSCSPGGWIVEGVVEFG